MKKLEKFAGVVCPMDRSKVEAEKAARGRVDAPLSPTMAEVAEHFVDLRDI